MEPRSILLFPQAMRDSLDEGHIVFRIMDVVETLDIGCITEFRLSHLESFVELFVQVLERISQAKRELEDEARESRVQVLRERAEEQRKKAETEFNPIEKKRKLTRATTARSLSMKRTKSPLPQPSPIRRLIKSI